MGVVDHMGEECVVTVSGDHVNRIARERWREYIVAKTTSQRCTAFDGTIRLLVE